MWGVAGIQGYRKQVATFERFGLEDIQRWQQSELTQLTRQALAYVPFYRQRRHLLQNVESANLETWPILQKADVISGGKDFYSENVFLRSFTATSGSTGSPMTIIRTPRSTAYERALIERQLRWAGWSRGDRRVWLRGDDIIPLQHWTGPFWRHNVAEQMLVCSSFHLRDDTIEHYLRAITEFDPVIIQAYPSSIACVARWLLANGKRYLGRKLRGIVTSSETLSDGVRRDIVAAFGVAVFDWYGQAERVSSIGTCSEGTYHVMEDSGFVEFSPQNNGTAMVISTGFGNAAMPLIRYYTGDAVVPKAPGFRCGCGSQFRALEKIVGRETDKIVTSDGREHVMLDFIFDYLSGLKEGQIVQQGLDDICINVVLHPGYTLDDVEPAVTRARQRFGAHVTVQLRLLDYIPRTSAGKFRLIVDQRKPNTASLEAIE
ncbi:phenylacetate--CoA ligase family protein [Duganella sp. FT135W]|uniref:Phenylacetate--CoA ligase family protein n=1 Tax=Duganella flavida TaxID=2692175 RepID=A0A6L8KEP3_9BURK|nr:phenylacetate--CoA ligase family protein [Duganella flavida]MYM24668.1 phenylacetate--CoA ligase family protein [Duganella flavida]